jgi:flagellar biosynthesis protein
MMESDSKRELTDPAGGSENDANRTALTAVALRYDALRDNAPRVTAKGHGYVAEEIIKLARQHKVPLRADPALVGTLATLDLGEHIPPELYRAVAEVLAFIYRLQRR